MSKSEKGAYFRHIFANNFFWCIFSKLQIRNQHDILRFLIPILNFLIKTYFLLSLALFVNFDCQYAGNDSKNGQSFFMNVSQNCIRPPSKGFHNQVVKNVVPQYPQRPLCKNFLFAQLSRLTQFALLSLFLGTNRLQFNINFHCFASKIILFLSSGFTSLQK